MNREQILHQLSQSRPVIAPSMLKCDFGNLDAEIRNLERSGADLIHWDVMDGHFVPNLSYGAMVIEKTRSRTQMLFEAHLMISDPASYVTSFLNAGCDIITFHVEAVLNPVPLLKTIRQANKVAGLAFNPETPVEKIVPYLQECDLLLTMSVEPGFGGQKFIPSVLDKVREITALSREALISIDGGIDAETIRDAGSAGVDLFVAGSAIFNHSDYTSAIQTLKQNADCSHNSPS